MKHKKLFEARLLILLAVLLFFGCTKEETKTPLTVWVKCTNSKLYSFNPLVTGASVYLFPGVNFATTNFEYLGAGKIKNKSTGEILTYTQMKTSSSVKAIVFEDLSNGIYGTVADVSTLYKIKTQLSTWNGASINLPESLQNYDNNTVEFVFDIWPYSVTDLGI
ncbi:MAG: hypothetical protein WCK18_15835 [Prolixibacteraceae bacterium]